MENPLPPPDPSIPNPREEEAELTQPELTYVMKHLYRQFAIESGADSDNAQSYPDATMEDFVAWVREEGEPLKSGDMMVQRMSIRPIAIKAIDHILGGSDFGVAGVLFPIWPLLVMQHRPPPAHSVEMCHVSVTIGFYDEKVLRVQGIARFEAGTAMSDGLICAFVQDQTNNMVNTLAMHGIDSLYDTHALNPMLDRGEVSQTQSPITPAPPGRMGFKGDFQ